MSEKIVIITGANSGIGKDVAFRFAKEGFTVVMACRSLEKSKPVKNEIMTSSQNETRRIYSLFYFKRIKRRKKKSR